MGRETVRDALVALVESTQADELVITTAVHSHGDRVRSYELIAEAVGLAARSSRRLNPHGRVEPPALRLEALRARARSRSGNVVAPVAVVGSTGRKRPPF